MSDEPRVAWTQVADVVVEYLRFTRDGGGIASNALVNKIGDWLTRSGRSHTAPLDDTRDLLRTLWPSIEFEETAVPERTRNRRAELMPWMTQRSVLVDVVIADEEHCDNDCDFLHVSAQRSKAGSPAYTASCSLFHVQLVWDEARKKHGYWRCQECKARETT